MLERSRVASGDTVLVTGASGGVGSAAVQLAMRRGARVIAVASLAKAESIEALGAERVIGRDADLTETLGHESVDVVIDVVGGKQFGSLLEILRRRGRYAVAGARPQAATNSIRMASFAGDATIGSANASDHPP
jgi:NADPH:quinone reductase-like Zn-dependent oxidoreductase